jgi:hypothetical protein
MAGEVSITGGIHPDGEVMPKCRVATNGNRTVLSSWDPERKRFREVDALVDTVASREGVHVTITGTSEALVNEVGLAPAAAQVVWRVRRKGCATCV